MSDDRFKQYEPFFGKWKIGRLLGKGSFGKVYEIYCEDEFGNVSKSALKVMHIPSDAALAIQKEEQPDMEAVRNFFLGQVERIKGEIRILQRCKGQRNIVNYEEHLIQENTGENEIGWDILIRMELLYPLGPYLTRKEASQLDIVHMWRDVASALIYCDGQNIIHRDIKPANILLGAEGQYKLTDFGVAIKNASRDEASTRVGTEKYMAPEVFRNQTYDKRADFYSLGCVIYYFLNRRRHVFMPPYPRQITAADNERAEHCRINGEEIPPIPWVSAEVNRILRKCMAYRPENRYQNAMELYKDLQHLLAVQGQDLRNRPLLLMKKQRGAAPAQKKPEQKVQSNVQREAPKQEPQSSIWDTPSPLDEAWGKAAPWDKTPQSRVPRESISSSYNRKSAAAPENVWENEAHMPQKALVDLPQKKQKSRGFVLPVILAVILLFAGGVGIGFGLMASRSGNHEEKTLVKTDVTETPTPTPESTATNTPIPESTVTNAPTPEPTATNTPTPEPTATNTPTPTPEPAATNTPTPEPSATNTPTPEPTATNTPMPTPEPTATNTPTPTPEPTATNTPTPTPEPTATNTPTPIPTTPLLGELSSPNDGGTVSSMVKYKGWVLTNDASADLQLGIDILDGTQVLQSVILDKEEMGSNTLEKRQSKYASEIMALAGYETKGSFELQGVSEGSYTLEFYVTDTGSDVRTVLQSMTIDVTADSGSGVSLEEVLQESGLSEGATHQIYENFAIGTDIEDENLTISGSQNQVILTGWLNADEGNSLTAILDIDGSTYTAENLAATGGSIEIIRGQRYLEAMDSALIGSTVRDMTQAGFVLKLSLPFLSPGEHTFRVTYNVGISGASPELVDMPEMTLTLSEGGSMGTPEENILAQWASEFPQPTEVPQVTETPLS